MGEEGGEEDLVEAPHSHAPRAPPRPIKFPISDGCDRREAFFRSHVGGITGIVDEGHRRSP